MIAKEILGIILGYLLGSIPTAYLVTRLVKGEDIRRLGGGNIGALNTMKTVGKLPALVVLIVDLGKGAAAVAIAYWVLNLPPLFVMLAGLASMVGHLWMIFLKFSGGRAMGAYVGSVTTVFCIYTDWLGLAIFLLLIGITLGISHNAPLATGAGSIALPFLAWFTAHSLLGVIMAFVAFLVIGGKFLPTGIAAWKNTKTKRDFFLIGGPFVRKKKNGI
jgi:glycerol-3-phosphate acyltransferase PlsY